MSAFSFKWKTMHVPIEGQSYFPSVWWLRNMQAGHYECRGHILGDLVNMFFIFSLPNPISQPFCTRPKNTILWEERPRNKRMKYGLTKNRSLFSRKEKLVYLTLRKQNFRSSIAKKSSITNNDISKVATGEILWEDWQIFAISRDKLWRYFINPSLWNSKPMRNIPIIIWQCAEREKLLLFFLLNCLVK